MLAPLSGAKEDTMSRFLRLSACAAGMLALAVLACLLLRDDEMPEAGSHEVAGKLVGFHEDAEASKVSRAVPVKNGTDAEAASEIRKEERTGAAKVKVLELARAAAENRAKSEAAAPSAMTAAASAVADSAASPSDSPANSPAPAKAATSADAVEAQAQELILSSVEPVSEKAPAPKAEEPEKKAVQAVAVKAPAAKKPEPKKPEAKKLEAKKPEAKKAAPKKAETRKAETANRPARLSAVESALADARSGRLAPAEDILLADDPAKTYDRVVTSAKFSMKGSLIKLTLRGNSPMIGHYYVLEDPDRVVLDLAGNWKIDVPKVPSNRLIGAVRVGQHEDKTRLVFDMKTMGKAVLVPLNRNALELRIK